MSAFDPLRTFASAVEPRRMARPLLIALIPLLTACVHHVDPQERLMQAIEASVSLPPGASPLSTYRRHYAWAESQSGLVEAVYVRGGEPDRLWLDRDHLPIVQDGGCGVVTFSYDVASGRAKSLRCN